MHYFNWLADKIALRLFVGALIIVLIMKAFPILSSDWLPQVIIYSGIVALCWGVGFMAHQAFSEIMAQWRAMRERSNGTV